jgi:sigma-54 dependent transcriptional regulator, acetoin dehydrogenase operon transcriptional activator AcoR
LRMQRLESLFGLSVGALVDRFRSPLATPLEAQTPSGLVFHVLARFNWPVWSQVTDAAAASVPAVVEAADAGLVDHSPPHGPAGLSVLLTGDPQVQAAVERVRRVMDEPIPILILGETGTGKSLLAAGIHAESARSGKPWVSFNCAALSDVQAQNALLLAVRTLQADGGTLYLQNIGEMPLPLQARLQQALQTAAVAGPERNGCRFALLCSSQTPLADLVRDRAFREDLYYSINALTVRLPPLRERTDVHALAQRVWERAGQPGELRLDAEAQVLFAAFDWPGNVRQMTNVLRTAALMAGQVAGQTAPLALRHLPEELLQHARPEAAAAALIPAAEVSLGELQLAAVQQALEAAKGNISEAAKRLGVSRNTVYRSLRRVNRHPS